MLTLYYASDFQDEAPKSRKQSLFKDYDIIRKLTKNIFETWWMAYPYRVLDMAEMARPDITLI